MRLHTVVFCLVVIGVLCTLAVPAEVSGAAVQLANVVVTAGSSELGDCFYIEEPNRTSGIKVTGQTAARGEAVTVTGVLTRHNGEVEIAATSVSHVSGGVDIRPLGMSFTNVGGGWAWRWVYNPVLHHSEYKWVQLIGLSTIALLVRTWGRVDSVDTSTKSFIITDGNRQYLKCMAAGLTPVQLPQAGQFVVVTGISATELNLQGQLEPLLRFRSQSDISVYPN